MGNSHNKTNQLRNCRQSTHSDRDGQAFISQLSLSFGNLSARSAGSGWSAQSSFSAARPWSRVSRRRWNDSTLSNPLDASKTAWPVAHKESIFLPEFPISTELQKDFEIQETIAKGAFGEVHKANKESEGKEYALKILSKSQIISEGAVRQVKEEARIQSAVGHHVFIAGAVARWQTKKRLYIVSEYISGGELQALLSKYDKLPEHIVKIFVAEIAVVLDFLHNAGVIYRDLKPENLLLDSNYHIQLVDFGLSKWLPFGGRTTTLCGTLHYMAPEVLGRQPYGHAVDWWSLGVIACRMLTGQFPTPVTSSQVGNDADSSVIAKETSANGHFKFNNGHIYASKAATWNPLAIYHFAFSIAAKPGSLPAGADELSKGARGLLLRLLDPDPRARLRTLRQLEQTAFYMGFHVERVKEKKVSVKSLLEEHFPSFPNETASEGACVENFFDFDQLIVPK